MDNRFKGKVCLVTGAGSGIGRATAARLSAEGGLVLVIDRNETAGQETADLIIQNNGEAFFSLCDVIKEKLWMNFFAIHPQN